MNQPATIAPIGHNNPPSDTEILAQKMRELYGDIIDRAEELLETEVPPEINDEETAGRVGDKIKQLTACRKALDAARAGEKEEYLKKGRAIDGFFKRFTERLDELKEKLAAPAGAYKDRKDAELRRQREEEARRQQEERDAKLRQAQEEARRAEELRRQQEEAARQAEREAAAERERIQKAHDEEKRRQQEEIERQRLAREEAERAVREAKAQKERDDAALKKAQEDLENARKAQKEAEERSKEVDRIKREEEKRLRDEQLQREADAKALSKEARQAERASNNLLDEAARHDRAASKMEKAADNVNARIRGEEGALITTTHFWVGRLQDRAILDLEALRQHLPEDALNQAIQSFVDADGRVLRGAHIYEDTKVQVR